MLLLVGKSGFKIKKEVLPTVKERWILHEAYVQLLVEVDKVKGNQTSSSPINPLSWNIFLTKICGKLE